MISFDEIKAFLRQDLKQKYCIEISFSVDGIPEYDECWMGKMPDSENPAKDVYWYGLVHDGSQAYDYDDLDDFLSAPVFHGQSLQQVWNQVTLETVNGGEPECWFSRRDQIQR